MTGRRDAGPSVTVKHDSSAGRTIGGAGMTKMATRSTRTSGRGGLLRRSAEHRSLRVWLAIAVVVAGVSVTGAIATVTSSPSTAGAASACADDGANGCLVTLPCASGTCPTVDVSPNVNLVDGQYLSIKTRNFDPTGSMRVAICALDTIVPSGGDPSCLAGLWEENQWSPISTPVLADPTTQNLASMAYPAFSDPSGQGNSLMPAQDLLGTAGNQPGFYCDNGADPCALVVTEEPFQGNAVGKGPAVSTSNSAVIPLSFLASSNGCPAGAAQLQTDSTYSLAQFMPVAVSSTCGGANGVVALNTATDGETATSDFAAGGAAVAFTDNPSDPTESANLAGKAYAFIPVALSGTAVSFLASESGNNVSSPLATYNLTSNMTAGLITSLYQFPTGQVGFVNGKPAIQLADNLVPPLDCTLLVGCASKNKLTQTYDELQYNSFNLLNTLGAGETGPTVLGSFMSDVPSGASYQVTDWICKAPNTPFPVTVNEVGQSSPVTVPVTDSNVAGTTLTTPPVGSSIWPPYQGAPWLFPTCQGYSTFPALAAAQGSSYAESSNPAFQAKGMRTWAYTGGVVPPQLAATSAAFGVMDSSESAFYGLDNANVQNAAGSFLAPTQASLEAAGNDLTPCPSGNPTCPVGTYQVNYGNTDAAAYAMPDITYAVVNTDPQSADQASAIKNLLTNLVGFSHSGSVPAGYAPLPDSLYKTAVADINADVNSIPAPPASPGTSNQSPVVAASPTGIDNSSSPSVGVDGQSLNSTGGTGFDSGSSALPLTTTDTSSSSGSKGTGGGSPGNVAVSTVPSGILLVSLDAASRYLLPAAIVLALAFLAAGSLLLLIPEVRRRRRGAEDPS
jgi:hypothetical protein